MNSPIAAAEAPAKAAPRRALVGWALFDWASQPFYTLILTFLFAPYFVNTVVGDASRGQAIWGYAAAAAGILVGIGSPLVGAIADGSGRRKPWIALFSLGLAGAMAVLWLATPGASGATLGLIVGAFVVATVMAELASVLVNAVMPTLVPPSQVGRLSGIGWGVGYAGGLISLLLIAGLVVADPASGRTLLGLEPLWKLDAATRQGDRLVGPYSALWFVVFALPFFLFVPDVRKVAAPAGGATPFRALWATIRELPQHPDMLYFLIARAIYSDGLSAIFTFGGIYGATVFGWQTGDRGLFGVVLVLTGVVGAVIGGFLDDRLGSRRVILGSLVALVIGTLGILSVTGTSVLFTFDAAAKVPGSRIFSSQGEQVFLIFALLVGLVAAPVQAASRTLLTHLAPPDKIAQFFGLFAFSGKVTAFLAPFAIALVTTLTGSQRLGMAVILAFLVVGLLLLLRVRAR